MSAQMIDPWTWEFQATYTDAPFPQILPWDGRHDIDQHKARVARIIRVESARRNTMLLARDSHGRELYVLSEGGVLKRRFELSSSRKRRVKDRDGNACVWCGSTKQLEVDHIIRYIDGGGNDESNLRTLCHRCHSKRGGRP